MAEEEEEKMSETTDAKQIKIQTLRRQSMHMYRQTESKVKESENEEMKGEKERLGIPRSRIEQLSFLLLLVVLPQERV